MKKGLGLLMVCALAVGCSSPTSPTPNPTSTPQKTAAADPATSPAPTTTPILPEFTVTEPLPSAGCVPVSQVSGRIAWIFQVAANHKTNYHLVAMVHHDDKAGCTATESNPRAAELDGTTEYPSLIGGSTKAYYNSQMWGGSCGHEQFDLSVIDADSGKQVFLSSLLVDKQKDCPASAHVDPPPPSNPTPDPPTIPPTPPTTTLPPATVAGCKVALINRSLTQVGGNAVYTFSIAPGYHLVPVSLVSYTYQIPGQFLPQTFVDGTAGNFDSGGPYHLQVSLNSYHGYQVDGLCGGFKHEDLDWPNWENDYRDRSMDWIYDTMSAPASIASYFRR